jgi:DNA-binding response OmpR family regulator
MPIIAISGAAVIDGRNTADVARDLGADATLIKPFRARELAALIERVLAARSKPA